jgi:hypothetical protein
MRILALDFILLSDGQQFERERRVWRPHRDELCVADAVRANVVDDRLERTVAVRRAHRQQRREVTNLQVIEMIVVFVFRKHQNIESETTRRTVRQ